MKETQLEKKTELHSETAHNNNKQRDRGKQLDEKCHPFVSPIKIDIKKFCHFFVLTANKKTQEKNCRNFKATVKTK